MLHDHASERHIFETAKADIHEDDETRPIAGPPGIPLDAFWAMVDPDRERAPAY